jgi:hypothetical protein
VDVGVLAVLLMVISCIDILLMENAAIVQVFSLLLALLVLCCCCLAFNLGGLLTFFLEGGLVKGGDEKEGVRRGLRTFPRRRQGFWFYCLVVFLLFCLVQTKKEKSGQTWLRDRPVKTKQNAQCRFFGIYLSVFRQINLECLGIVLEPKRLHCPQDILAVDSLALLQLTSVAGYLSMS